MRTKMIGDRILQARKNQNMTQAQLAEQLFISPQAVGKWERGESLPDIVTLNRMSMVLKVDLNYFSDHVEPKHTDTKPRPENDRLWNMSRGNWVDADFSGLGGLQEKFNNSNLKCCKFIGAELSGLILGRNLIDDCDFSDSNLSDCHMKETSLSNSKLRNSSLVNSKLSKCQVIECDFSEANLTSAKFEYGFFSKNSVENTVWSYTSFTHSKIENVVFQGMLDNCSFDRCSFKKVIFENSTLINCFFKSEKLKKIKFIDCKADRMTLEFLKNGKADLSGVSLME